MVRLLMEYKQHRHRRRYLQHHRFHLRRLHRLILKPPHSQEIVVPVIKIVVEEKWGIIFRILIRGSTQTEITLYL
jgi:hypothetical protein